MGFRLGSRAHQALLLPLLRRDWEINSRQPDTICRKNSLAKISNRLTDITFRRRPSRSRCTWPIDRRRLSSVNALLPVALDFGRWLVLVFVVVPSLLSLSNLFLGDLRDGGWRGGHWNRLSLNRALLLLASGYLLIANLLRALLLLLLLLFLQALDLRRSERFRAIATVLISGWVVV